MHPTTHHVRNLVQLRGTNHVLNKKRLSSRDPDLAIAVCGHVNGSVQVYNDLRARRVVAVIVVVRWRVAKDKSLRPERLSRAVDFGGSRAGRR